jgi:hypothetical protein
MQGALYPKERPRIWKNHRWNVSRKKTSHWDLVWKEGPIHFLINGPWWAVIATGALFYLLTNLAFGGLYYVDRAAIA